MALEQRRFAEAEASYRQALDIFQESDPSAASSTASMLGIALAMLGRHQEAVRTLLYAAVTWHQQTGQWHSHDLAWLHRECALTSPGDLAALISTDVSPELADDLTAAIEQAKTLPTTARKTKATAPGHDRAEASLVAGQPAVRPASGSVGFVTAHCSPLTPFKSLATRLSSDYSKSLATRLSSEPGLADRIPQMVVTGERTLSDRPVPQCGLDVTPERGRRG